MVAIPATEPGSSDSEKRLAERLEAGQLKDSVVSELIKVKSHRFINPLNCEGTVFHEDVLFEDCVFEGMVVFRGAKTPERLSFQRCVFKEGASFAAGVSKATGAEVEVETLRHIKLAGCTIDGYVTFNNRKFTRSPDFTNSRFLQPPHFQGSQFHPGTRFDGTVFEVPKNPEDARRACQGFRTLKIAAKSLADSERYSEFAAAELISRLNAKSSDPLERFLIRMYGFISNYGRSIARPLVLMIASLLISSLLILLRCDPRSWASWGDSLLFTTQQAVSPFSALSRDVAPGAVNQVLQSHRAFVIVVCGIQSVLTVGCIALFLFALRRRFVQ